MKLYYFILIYILFSQIYDNGIFSISYPKSWDIKVDCSGRNVTFFNPKAKDEGDFISISYYSKGEKYDREKKWMAIKKYLPNNIKILKDSFLNINKLECNYIKYQYTLCNKKFIKTILFVDHGNYFYLIQFNSTIDKYNQNEKIFLKIINSLNALD